MTQEEFLHQIAQFLESAGIPFMVAGSHASGHHGIPRSTLDVDIVIDPTPKQLAAFLAFLSEDYYASPTAAQQALRRRSMFNVIHSAAGWKADLIVCKDRPFDREEFRRRRIVVLYGNPVPAASAEDMILAKLEWNRITPSERQLQDACNVAIVQWPRLDQEYLQHWAAELGLLAELKELLRQAEQLQPPFP
jgi:hypothetical protein